MRPNLGSILGRVVTVVAGLLLAGIVLRLIVAVLAPVLPAQLSRDLMTGWDMLYSIVSPAVPPIAAIAILGALVWVIIGRRR